MCASTAPRGLIELDVTSNATTRAARTAAGKCAVCLKRRATPGNSTCATCRKRLRENAANRYEKRRRARKCVRCKKPTGGAYLCPEHVAERKRTRSS